MATGYVLDPIFIEHRAPAGHPERPERLTAVRDALRAVDLDARATCIEARAAAEDEIGRVHRAGYVDDLVRTLPGQSGWLCEDTYFSPDTWEATRKAAGAVIDLTTSVLDGRLRSGMALVRPPGHHAEVDRAMGFCILNNVALAAAAARAQGAARVAILDWDVHHGNGTQHIFDQDPSVLFLSCHQYPHYPGTGRSDDVGAGAGRGATVNVGLPAGSGDGEYQAVFEDVFLPALRRFRPDVLLISAGFDSFVDDPLSGTRVTEAGFRFMAQAVRSLADEVCEGRLVCALEGGYDLHGISRGAVALLDALAPRGPAPAPPRDEGAAGEGREIAAGARAAIDQTLAALAAAGGVPTPAGS